VWWHETSTDSVQLKYNLKYKLSVTNRQFVEHEDYCIAGNCRTKIPTLFREDIWNFLRYLKICIYLLHGFWRDTWRYSAELTFGSSAVNNNDENANNQLLIKLK
jgi:hypothetical protein